MASRETEGYRRAMDPTGVIPDITVDDLDAARRFYGFLGLTETTMDQGWVVRLESPDGRARVQLVTRDATSPVPADLSLPVGDAVRPAYVEAQERGYEIVYPLTTEPWGVTRFFVRAPDGTVVNVVSHRDD